MSVEVEEVSLYFLGGDPIPYIGLVPIDPRSSLSVYFGATVYQPVSRTIRIG